MGELTTVLVESLRPGMASVIIILLEGQPGATVYEVHAGLFVDGCRAESPEAVLDEGAPAS
jgi:hypothetical protein